MWVVGWRRGGRWGGGALLIQSTAQLIILVEEIRTACDATLSVVARVSAVASLASLSNQRPLHFENDQSRLCGRMVLSYSRPFRSVVLRVVQTLQRGCEVDVERLRERIMPETPNALSDAKSLAKVLTQRPLNTRVSSSACLTR